MNRDPRGLYAALGVPPDATPAEIQRSFRALMRRRHPDLHAAGVGVSGAGVDGGDDARRILESFTVLRNPKLRAEYDPAGSSASREDQSHGSRDIPVRHHPARQPVLRVTPVRWERGPE